MDSAPVSIRLLTFNLYGLKYIAKHRQVRLRAIADRLAHPDSDDDNYHIVALQELWCEEDWDYFDSVCAKRYPYRRIFRSGIVTGPGLALLSKIPISETFLYRFPINGRPSAFFRGDWLVGKSIAVTLLKPHTADATPLAILNSHMHAPYSLSGDASYSTHRAAQAWDLSKLVKVLKHAGYAVIQVGDLNSRPGSLPYRLFTIEGGLKDSWEVLNQGSVTSDDLALLSPQEQIILGGVTCDSQLNTFRAKRERWEACRLDYALIDTKLITPISASVKFTETLPPPHNCSLSDHFAYSADFIVAPKTLRLPPYAQNVAENVAEKLTIYDELIHEIQTYRDYTIPWQANWRKWHLIISLVVVIAIHIGATWAASVSSWSSVLLIFLSTVVGITGCVNGMIWYFGVRSELRALQEVQLEVKDLLFSTKTE